MSRCWQHAGRKTAAGRNNYPRFFSVLGETLRNQLFDGVARKRYEVRTSPGGKAPSQRATNDSHFATPTPGARCSNGY